MEHTGTDERMKWQRNQSEMLLDVTKVNYTGFTKKAEAYSFSWMAAISIKSYGYILHRFVSFTVEFLHQFHQAAQALVH